MAQTMYAHVNKQMKILSISNYCGMFISPCLGSSAPVLIWLELAFPQGLITWGGSIVHIGGRTLSEKCWFHLSVHR
jgi:hypothetical protein